MTETRGTFQVQRDRIIPPARRMNTNLREKAPILSSYFPEPSCSGNSETRIGTSHSSPAMSGQEDTQFSFKTSKRQHRIIINRIAAIAIDKALLPVEKPEMTEIILNDFQDNKGKRKKSAVLSDLTALTSDSITIQLKKEYLKRKMTPEPLFFHPNQIIEEIDKKFEDEFKIKEKACSVKQNVRRYTPAILKALLIQNNTICRQEIQSIAQGIEEKHMKMAYGNLPSLLEEGSPQELDWYKQIKGRLHPLSFISSSVAHRVEEEISVADALLLRIGLHLLLLEVAYPQEFQRTFAVLERLLFEIEPRQHTDYLTTYTINRLLRFEKEKDYLFYC